MLALDHFKEFVAAYLEAAEFSDLPEDMNKAECELDAASLERATGECRAFFDAHTADILAYGIEQAGHDLWFTRNGHGVGFWEEDHGTPEILKVAINSGPGDLEGSRAEPVRFRYDGAGVCTLKYRSAVRG